MHGVFLVGICTKYNKIIIIGPIENYCMLIFLSQLHRTYRKMKLQTILDKDREQTYETERRTHRQTREELRYSRELAIGL